MSDNIQVVVRCRARNDREVEARSPAIVQLPDPVFSRNSSYIHVDVNPDTTVNNTYSVDLANVQKTQKRFKVDQVYGPGADQTLFFENVALPLFQDFVHGSNVTILAYGQTGSGKTHTMCGEMSGDGAGIIPRVVSRLFRSLDSDNMVKISCVELYKEELRDLIEDDLELSSVKTKLRLVPDLVRESTGAPKIQNLCELPIDSAEMALKIVGKCFSRRRVAATKLNDLSSRSHTILSLILYKEVLSTLGNSQFRISRMNLVDLAGSEDINKSGAMNERAREAGSINQSLLALGKVINCLSEGKDPKHVPYRESKLTRLLQGLLGGKTKTALIATVSPARVNMSETLSTLNYASKAKNIKNLPQLINDSDYMLKRVLVTDLAAQISKMTRDFLALKDKDESIKISHQNYIEYTSSIANLQSHLVEKLTSIASLETALDSKNSEISALHAKCAAAEKKLADSQSSLDGKDQEIMRLNLRFFKLQEKYLQQNQKLAQIMDSNISGVNESLKNVITRVSGDRSRLNGLIELSKHKLIDDLICSQSSLATGLEELQKQLAISDYLDNVFSQHIDLAPLRVEVEKLDFSGETRRLLHEQDAFKEELSKALQADVYLSVLQAIVRQSAEETSIAKQRLVAELSNTVETMFGVHQNKFEQALHQVAGSVLGGAESLMVEKFDDFHHKNQEIAGNLSTMTENFKMKLESFDKQLVAGKARAKELIAKKIEQQLDRSVTQLTGTALQQTEATEKGILLTLESLSKQLDQSGVQYENGIAAASADLHKVTRAIGTMSPNGSADKLAIRLINTLGSPKPKKRKVVSSITENPQMSRIPQLSPVKTGMQAKWQKQ